MRLGLAVLLALVLAPAGVPATIAAEATGATTAWMHGGAIDGQWNSNIGAIYEITQHGRKFVWWSERLNETAMGTVDDTNIRALWSGRNGDGRGTAVIKRFDQQGRARRIEWSNGVIFTR